MGRFSRFFTHRAMLLIWNHDLIRFPLERIVGVQYQVNSKNRRSLNDCEWTTLLYHSEIYHYRAVHSSPHPTRFQNYVNGVLEFTQWINKSCYKMSHLCCQLLNKRQWILLLSWNNAIFGTYYQKIGYRRWKINHYGLKVHSGWLIRIFWLLNLICCLIRERLTVYWQVERVGTNGCIDLNLSPMTNHTSSYRPIPGVLLSTATVGIRYQPVGYGERSEPQQYSNVWDKLHKRYRRYALLLRRVADAFSQEGFGSCSRNAKGRAAYTWGTRQHTQIFQDQEYLSFKCYWRKYSHCWRNKTSCWVWPDDYREIP